MEKINKKRRAICLMSSTVAVAAATAFAAFAFVCLELMIAHYRITKYNNISFNKDILRHAIGRTWMFMIPLAIVFVVTLIIAIIKAGDFDETGRITVRGFDKLLNEVHIALMIAVSAVLYPSVTILLSWVDRGSPVYDTLISTFSPAPIPESLNFKLYGEYTSLIDYAFDPPAVALVVSLTGIFASLWIYRLCLLAIVKKLKAHCFWKRTLPGILFTYLYHTCEKSPHTFAKVMIIAVTAVLVSATGYGAIIVLILLFIFIPCHILRFTEISKSTEKISKGDLKGRIPIRGTGDLDRLAANINSLADSKDAAVRNELKNQRLKTDLISNVSHDLRTPLTSMVTYICLLQNEGLDSPNAPEYLEILSRKTERLRHLTDDLFEAAKASSGDIPYEIKKIEITSILNQALAELGEKLEQNNIKIIVSSPDHPACVYADGNLLWRVIENLLTNISKYAVPGSRAYIDISRVGENIKLEIKNMSKDQLNIDPEELMERFRRGDISRNTEGSGLGLSIAKDLTELMHGKFKIEIDGDLFKASAELREAL